MKKRIKLALVLNNFVWFIVYFAMIFVYFMYIAPAYPLPFTDFWAILTLIITLVYIAIGFFVIISFAKSIVEFFKKK
ncbi:MAG: hypothetical protein ACP5NZ_01200 [Nanobdellota archaeon]